VPGVSHSARWVTINNTPPTHPAIQRAGLLHSIAETLAGGPRYSTAINPDGTRTVTKVPLSKGAIGMAIALEAIGGALSGYGVKNGPGNRGRAAAAGFDNAVQQRQQADQLQQQQAQQDANNQAQALARKATIFETNMRGMLNAAEVEKYGADAIDKLVQLNRESGLLDPSADYVENGGVPMTQQELTDAMAKGTIAPTDHLGPIAGRVELTNPDGTKRWETTHLILKSGDERVPLTQDDWNRYSAHGVKGFPASVRIGDGQTVKLSIKANANEQLAAHLLSEYRLNGLRDILDGTPEAAKVPSKVDWSIPGNDRAMQIYQKHISHDAENSSDPFLALKAMGADKRSPDGTMKPNPDAKYVNTVADAFGGWPVLEAAHNQLLANKQNAEKYSIVDTQDKAEAILSAPKKFSLDQVSAARNFVQLSQQLGVGKAVSEVRARAVAEGKDVEAMYKTGVNPITKEKLTLDNAPDSMLVDAQGRPVPQNQQPLYKPTQMERQTADTARQALAISQGLRQAVQQNPNLIGPLVGRSKEGLAKLGIGDAQAQKLLNDISFLQSAATKVHTGRFSNEILSKMAKMIQPGMNADQFGGALDSIDDVMQRYANEDKLITVAEYRNMQNARTPVQPSPKPNAQPSGKKVIIPAGAVLGRDAKGNIVAYKLPSGQIVKVQ
jgi:hypothetical protein